MFTVYDFMSQDSLYYQFLYQHNQIELVLPKRYAYAWVDIS